MIEGPREKISMRKREAMVWRDHPFYFFKFFAATSLTLFALTGCGGQYTDYTQQPGQNDARTMNGDVVGSLPPGSPPGSGSESNRPNGSHVPGIRPPEHLIEAAKNGRLECANDSECLDSVVLISIPTEKGVSRCSGVLISEDEVLTNDHCVKRTSAEWIYVHFSKNVNSEVAQIKVRSYETGPDSIDYAVLKLKEKITDRKPAPQSQRGFQNTELANIYRVQMVTSSSGQMNGIQTRLICRASHRTMLYPAVQDSRFPVMTFGDCPIESGNSGSPAFNANGELAAVIQGYYVLKDMPEVERELQELSIDSDFGKVAVGTQVMCMSALNPRSNVQCTSWVGAMGMKPHSYAQQFGSVPLPKVPYSTPGKQWRRPTQELTSNAITFIQTPKCLYLTELESQELTLKKYRKGLSRAYVMEWRERASTESFSVVQRGQDQIQLQSSSGLQVHVPVCKE